MSCTHVLYFMIYSSHVVYCTLLVIRERGHNFILPVVKKKLRLDQEMSVII